jgi:hypothetical protein
MLSTNPETVEAANPATPPQPNFRVRWWLRTALFTLQIAILLVAGLSCVPDQHAFQFGYSYGFVLICSSIFLWCLLVFTQTRRGIFVFCGLVLVQAGLVVLVGLQSQARDRALDPILEEFTKKQYELASQLGQFRLDPLFEMTSGKRQLSITQLQELRVRARDGQAQVDIVKADMIRSRADFEHRVSAVSAREARNFRLGYETSAPVFDKAMDELKAYFTECEELLAFLIDRQGQYSQTPDGLKFKRAEDAQFFNNHARAIALLGKEIAALEHASPLQ